MFGLTPNRITMVILENDNFNTSKLCGIHQGPLKKWTEHSQELHLLKIHSRGAPITPRSWMGVDFLDHELL